MNLKIFCLICIISSIFCKNDTQNTARQNFLDQSKIIKDLGILLDFQRPQGNRPLPFNPANIPQIRPPTQNGINMFPFQTRPTPQIPVNIFGNRPLPQNVLNMFPMPMRETQQAAINVPQNRPAPFPSLNIFRPQNRPNLINEQNRLRPEPPKNFLNLPQNEINIFPPQTRPTPQIPVNIPANRPPPQNAINMLPLPIRETPTTLTPVNILQMPIQKTPQTPINIPQNPTTPQIPVDTPQNRPTPLPPVNLFQPQNRPNLLEEQNRLRPEPPKIFANLPPLKEQENKIPIRPQEQPSNFNQPQNQPNLLEEQTRVRPEPQINFPNLPPLKEQENKIQVRPQEQIQNFIAIQNRPNFMDEQNRVRPEPLNNFPNLPPFREQENKFPALPQKQSPGLNEPLNRPIQQLPQLPPGPPNDDQVCGKLNRVGRLINGVTVKSLPYPWVVPLIVLFNPNEDLIKTRLCTGTLIHRAFILTAASCFKGISNKESTVRMGFNTLNISAVYDGENMQEIKIFLERNVFLHPGFSIIKDENGDAVSSINDLALIRLDKLTNIMPACVPYFMPGRKSYPMENSVLSVFSWGKTNNENDFPDTIRGTRLRVLPAETCSNSYNHPDFNTDTLFCGKNSKIKTCGYLGDIGAGAYVYDENNLGVLTGVLTLSKFDDLCEKPDIFQRVSTNVEWIRKVITSPVFNSFYKHRIITKCRY